jgi:Carboxypeptidase regulatory-like domain
MNVAVRMTGLLSVLAVLPAQATQLSGMISNSAGEPIHGVMVRLSDSHSGVSESVYSGPDGSYQLQTSLAGELSLRLRAPYTRDMTFTDDGKVCTSNNPLPPAALEGGVLQIICIDPESRANGSVAAISVKH